MPLLNPCCVRVLWFFDDILIYSPRIRKLLIEFNQQRQNQSGLRNFLSLPSDHPHPSSSSFHHGRSQTPNLYRFVKDFPFVEFVVKPTGGSAILKGFYLNNNRTKTIPVDGLDPNQIHHKIQLLLNSSGQKLNKFTSKNSVSVSIENSLNPTRGHFSALHQENHLPRSKLTYKTK